MIRDVGIADRAEKQNSTNSLSMNLVDCYQVLGLKAGVSVEEMKGIYRRLARQYHPDVNPGDSNAREKFMAISAAYQYLLQLAQSNGGQVPVPPSETCAESSASASAAQTGIPVDESKVKIKVQSTHSTAELSPEMIALKQEIHQKLQDLYQGRHYALAVTLIESLAERLSEDVEVKKWQAIAYQKMGRQLASQRQFHKARMYLKQALKSDPRNPRLWEDVERDFRYIERYSGLS